MSLDEAQKKKCCLKELMRSHDIVIHVIGNSMRHSLCIDYVIVTPPIRVNDALSSRWPLGPIGFSSRY